MNNKLGPLLKSLLEYDPETFDHCVRVSRACRRLATYLGLTDHDARILVLGGLTHDIGKLDVPKEVLRSPEPLDDWGFGEIKKHPRVGYILLRPVLGEEVARLVVSHHEPGYPRSEIRDGESGRLRDLLRLTDKLDALRSERSYKRSYSNQECRRILLIEGFDGNLIDLLLSYY